MRILYVLSDVTYPAREGLHEQSLLLARCLSVENDLGLLVFARDKSMNTERLRSGAGASAVAAPVVYSGSSVTFAVRMKRRLRSASLDAILGFNPDVVILEGPVAGRLAPGLRRLHIPFVMHWVDPGSRRFCRLRSTATSFGGKFRYAAAAVLYRSLERLSMDADAWTFVSVDDAEWVRREFPEIDVRAIPVMLPEVALKKNRASLSEVGRILVYIDARTVHGRNALIQALGEIAAVASSIDAAQVRIMARVHEDEELRSAGPGLQATFLPWVDDIAEELSSAEVVVLPDLVGTGLKNRTVQSLALAQSVVGTRVAFEGFPLSESVRADCVYDVGRLGDHLLRVVGKRPAGNVAAPHVATMLSNHHPSNVTRRWQELLEEVRTRG